MSSDHNTTASYSLWDRPARAQSLEVFGIAFSSGVQSFEETGVRYPEGDTQLLRMEHEEGNRSGGWMYVIVPVLISLLAVLVLVFPSK